EAALVLEQAIKLDDSPKVHKQLADAYAQTKRREQAIKEYDAALADNPNYIPALNALANTLIEQYQLGSNGDDALRLRALKSWHQSLAANSNQPQVASSIKQWEN